MARLFDSVGGLLTATARQRGLELEFTLDERLPQSVLGDEVRLRQILFNLVGNAIKFSDKGIIRAQACPLPFALKSKQRILFMVSDEGIGISDEILDLIFEPFSQGEGDYTRRFQGAGLGLSIVKRLVGMMGGEIAIDSALGEGTTIYISLPFELPPNTAEEDVSSGNTTCFASYNTTLRVLLAEDDRLSVVAAKALLEKCGCVVTVANDGRQALQLLAERSRPSRWCKFSCR